MCTLTSCMQCIACGSQVFCRSAAARAVAHCVVAGLQARPPRRPIGSCGAAEPYGRRAGRRACRGSRSLRPGQPCRAPQTPPPGAARGSAATAAAHRTPTPPGGRSPRRARSARLATQGRQRAAQVRAQQAPTTLCSAVASPALRGRRPLRLSSRAPQAAAHLRVHTPGCGAATARFATQRRACTCGQTAAWHSSKAARSRAGGRDLQGPRSRDARHQPLRAACTWPPACSVRRPDGNGRPARLSASRH